MAKSVQLEVITPSKLFYKGEVGVITRTLQGDEGFMADHAKWACKLLDTGELWFREVGKTV